MAGSVSFQGINYIQVGIKDDEGNLIKGENGVSESGIAIIDGDGQGATTANITGLEGTGTDQYANNKLKRVAYGAPTPQVALTMLDMDFNMMQKLKGYVSDGKGGYVLSSGKKPHVALLICSTGFDGEKYYDTFANGEMSEVAHNHGTNTATEVDAEGTFAYKALAPIEDNVFVDNKGVQRPYKQFTSVDAGFTEDAMLAEVFNYHSGPSSVDVPSDPKNKEPLI